MSKHVAAIKINNLLLLLLSETSCVDDNNIQKTQILRPSFNCLEIVWKRLSLCHLGSLPILSVAKSVQM